jgi:hypothetical protein
MEEGILSEIALFEPGKRYRMRDGGIAGPLKERADFDYPFEGIADTSLLLRTWTAEGKHCQSGESQYDLWPGAVDARADDHPPLAHILYETGDLDAPEPIKDGNGEVVLGLCRVCGRGEVELEGACPGNDKRAARLAADIIRQPKLQAGVVMSHGDIIGHVEGWQPGFDLGVRVLPFVEPPNADAIREVNPWIPMSMPIDLKHLGKLGEELNECGAAVFRCIIQGIAECEPMTKVPNRHWLENELADVQANRELVIEHFGLDVARMAERTARKKVLLRAWHAMLADPEPTAALLARIAQLEALINSPETSNWMVGVPLEAAHQIERWGAAQDAGKSPADWFWLVGYLAGKVLGAIITGDLEKAKHHTISTGAALLNWHRSLTGESTEMRPGIALPAEATS